MAKKNVLKATSLSALALMLGSVAANAAVPANTIVIGNKAFSVGYLVDDKNAAEIQKALDALTDPTQIYYQLEGEAKWTNLLDDTKQLDNAGLAAVIPTVTYYDADGKTTEEKFVEAPVTGQLAVSAVSARNINNEEVAFGDSMAPYGTLVFQLNGDVVKDDVTTANIKVVKAEGNVSVAGKVSYNEVTKQIKFEVAGNDSFANNETYKVTIANIRSKADANVKLSYEKTFKTGEQLIVENVSLPALGSLGNNVVLTFNKAVDASTVTTSNIKLYNVTDASYIAETDATIAVSGNGTIATFDPSITLPANKKFKLIISDNVKSLDGQSLAANLNIEFNTFAAWSPSGKTVLVGTDSNTFGSTFTNVNPMLVGNKAGTKVGFVYKLFTGTNLDATTINSANVYIQSKVDKKIVEASVNYDSVSGVITILPTSDLKGMTQYQVVFSENVKDTNGNKLGSDVVSGTITTGDFTAPTLEKVSVENGSIVKFGTKLNFTFSEKMNVNNLKLADNSGNWDDGTGAGKATIQIKNLTSNTYIDATGLTMTTSTTEDGKTVVTVEMPKFDSPAPFAKDNTYQVEFKGFDSTQAVNIYDKNASTLDNALQDSYKFTFTTEGKDQTAPTVAEFKQDNASAWGYNYRVAVPATNVRSDRDLYITFSELMNQNPADLNADNITEGDLGFNTATGTTDANDVIVVEKYNKAQDRWERVTTTGTETGVNPDNTKTYVTINASVLAANEGQKLRVKVLPKTGDGTANAAVDVAGNFLADEWVSPEFVVDAKPSLVTSNVDAGGNFDSTNDIVDKTLAGNKFISKVLNGSGDNNDPGNAVVGTIKVNDVITAKLATGAYFTTTVTGKDNTHVYIADELPALLNDDALVIQGTNVKALQNDFSSSEPVVITIAGQTKGSEGLGAGDCDGQTVILTGGEYTNLGSPIAGEKILLTPAGSDFAKMYTIDSVNGTTLTLATTDDLDDQITYTASRVLSEVDTNTITPETIKLRAGAVDKNVKLTVTKVNNDAYVVIVPLKDDGTTTTLDPNSSYTVAATGVKDTVGNAIKDTSFNFSTSTKNAYIEVASQTIADGAIAVDRWSTLGIKFNAPINVVNNKITKEYITALDTTHAPEDANGEYVKVFYNNNGVLTDITTIPGIDGYQYKLSTDGTSLSLRFRNSGVTVKMPADTEITVQLFAAGFSSSASTDYALEANEPSETFYQYTFRTATAAQTPAEVYSIYKTDASSASNELSYNSTTNVFSGLPVDAPIAVEFDKDYMNLAGATIKLTKEGSTGSVNLGTSYTTGGAADATATVRDTIIITPVSDLEDDTLYNLTISGLKDQDGNILDDMSYGIRTPKASVTTGNATTTITGWNVDQTADTVSFSGTATDGDSDTITSIQYAIVNASGQYLQTDKTSWGAGANWTNVTPANTLDSATEAWTVSLAGSILSSKTADVDGAYTVMVRVYDGDNNVVTTPVTVAPKLFATINNAAETISITSNYDTDLDAGDLDITDLSTKIGAIYAGAGATANNNVITITAATDTGDKADGTTADAQQVTSAVINGKGTYAGVTITLSNFNISITEDTAAADAGNAADAVTID